MAKRLTVKINRRDLYPKVRYANIPDASTDFLLILNFNAAMSLKYEKRMKLSKKQQ